MIPITADLDEAIIDTQHEFSSRWGNEEMTAQVTMWEDGEFQIEVFHTLDSVLNVAGKGLRRRISTLRDVDGTFEHREYMVHDGQRVGEVVIHD